jgi:NAD(P)H-dependent flavin oxidoreductase YrpB (nitropropane dioxygenase family)
MAASNENKYAQEWTEENAQPRFIDALKFAQKNDTCLCLQDAIIESGIPSRTFYYLSNNHEVLQTIKQDIHDVIVSRVNRLALDRVSACPAAPAIWRMKQLGEKDETTVTTKGSVTNKIIVSDAETEAAIQEMKDKFDKE